VTPFPSSPTWRGQRRGERGMATVGGDRAGDETGEGEQGLPERLALAALAVGRGG
jgi:hypothetical protein